MTNAETPQQTATMTLAQAIKQAVVHHQAGQLHDAERLYRAILQTHPNHPDANHNLGALAVQVKQPAAGLPHFKAALQANPKQGQYWLSYIDALLAAGSVDEAQSVLEQGLRHGLSENGASALMTRIRNSRLAASGASDFFAEAAAHLKDGRYEEAVAIYRKCIAAAPNAPENHVSLGNAYREQGKLEEAINCYQEALVLHPDDADAYANQGRALYLMGHFEEAIAGCQIAIRLCPEHVEAMNTLGNVLFLQGKLDDAVTCYRQALAVYPDFPKALHNLGNALQWMDQDDDSINARLKFIALDAADTALKANAAVSLAVMYYLRDDLQAAREMNVRVSMLLQQTKSRLSKETIYCRYLNQLLQWWSTAGIGQQRSEPTGKLYVIGESHALAYHNIEVELDGSRVLCKTRWIAGCKQWHIGNAANNMQKFLFRKMMGALPHHATILLNFGEIDCRYDGGIIKAWKKDVRQSLHGMALTTISEYLKFVAQIAAERDQKLIICGVPATNAELDKLAAEQVEQFTGLLKFFNNQLREQSALAGLGFIDLFSMTDGGNGISNQQWHIEDIHLRPDAVPEAFKKHYRAPAAVQINKDGPTSCKEGEPSPQEINTVKTLFSEGRYAAALPLAQTMTDKFPRYMFGWKALGALFKQIGRSADALMPMRMAVALSPDDAGAHSNLGATLLELRQLEEAEAMLCRALQLKPDLVEAHINLGITLRELGRLSEAESSFRQALQLKPDLAEAHSNLGLTLHKLGRLNEAENSCLRALEINPDCTEAHSNLGNILKEMGLLDRAVTSYRRALQIKPDYAEMHSNLGVTLQGLGCTDEAESCYRRALQLKPDFAMAHSNLGLLLQEMGRLDEADSSYRRALQIKPDYVDALNNLALLLNVQAEPNMALDIIKQSLRIKETAEAKSIFVDSIKRLRWAHDDSEIRTIMVRALTEPWGRPSELALFGTNLVKFNPVIGDRLTQIADAWPTRLSAQNLFGSNDLAALAADPLLRALLNAAPVNDIELESFLTMVRCAMLETATGMEASDDEVGADLSFYSALACQCFINEYVFSYTEDEIRKANDLRDSLEVALKAKAQVPELWPLAVAAYFPLCSLPFAAWLLERRWSDAVGAVLLQQLSEPAEELQLRATLPRLTSIEDEVSQLVQSQYEENPYPRWVKAAPAGQGKNINEYLGQRFPLASFKRYDKGGSIDILIAGCGTGQHSIGAAQRFRSARVLAVDLSLSSLAYAKRKTQELGSSSIEYAQADLLKLGSLGRSFDVIESVGVLHHLADPWAGWKVLLSLLRPDGFMKLGFYSEVARRNVVRIRDYIAARDYGLSANEIRRCRQDLAKLDQSADFGIVLKSSDFFSISNCRDLLFHVQEHRMTLTGIEAFLRENNLALLGFEIDPQVLLAYKKRFPDDLAATNLGQWQIFENENPDTFFGMYQFWIQKN